VPRVRIFTGGQYALRVPTTLVVFAAILAWFAASTPAYAQGGGIREIRVAGNRRVEVDTVRAHLRFGVGDAYDPAMVNASIKALFATGLFADVRIDRDGAGVLVTVRENPVVNLVSFEGNSQVERASLESEVQLKPRSTFTRARVQADVWTPR
jgi:outer membrane protein insertion porin family